MNQTFLLLNMRKRGKKSTTTKLEYCMHHLYYSEVIKKAIYMYPNKPVHSNGSDFPKKNESDYFKTKYEKKNC